MKYLKLAKEILEQNYHGVGVRSLSPDENYKIGDNCRDSYSWDFEADTSSFDTDGQTAGATCATKIDIQYFKTDDRVKELSERIESVIAQNEIYGSEQVIIAGNSGLKHDDLFDPEEVRIINAFVIDVI